MKTIVLGCYGIVIMVNDDGEEGGGITSYLHEDCKGEKELNAAIDGIESMVLAHACAGVDVESPRYIEGIETTVDAVLNNVT